MKEAMHMKVVIVEDNDFFNKLITNYVNRVLEELTTTHRFTYLVNTYSNSKDCLKNFEPDTSLMFTDFYFGDGSNAIELLEHIKRKRIKCKVIVMSQLQTDSTVEGSYAKGAYAFFRKDRSILQKCSDLLYSHIEENTKKHLN